MVGYYIGVLCLALAAVLAVYIVMPKRNKTGKAAAAPLWLLVPTGDGWQLRPGKPGPDETVWCEGVYYPREFLRPLGRDSYMVPSHFLMPRDGSLAHHGDVPNGELMPVAHIEYIAHWKTFWGGTRRIIWSKIWQRTDGSTAALKNMASAMTICAALLMIWSTWGLRSRVDNLASAASTLSGQVGAAQEAAKAQGERPLPAGAQSPGEPRPLPADKSPDPVGEHDHTRHEHTAPQEKQPAPVPPARPGDLGPVDGEQGASE